MKQDFFFFFLNHRPDSSWISGHKQSSVCGTQTKEVMCEQVLVKSQDINRTWLQRREWKRCSHRVHSCIFSTFISLWQGAWYYCTCKLFILPSTTTTKILWSAWKNCVLPACEHFCSECCTHMKSINLITISIHLWLVPWLVLLYIHSWSPLEPDCG